jgi:stringent starvation protein B
VNSKPKRPYLLRALYDWIVDSDLTPYVLVNAGVDGVAVPADFVENGRIVLNVAPHAVRDLTLDNAAVACQCRFRGQPYAVYLPIRSIEAIYAKETGEGMAFDAETFPDPPDGSSGPQDGGGSDGSGGPDKPAGHLKVVK